jgi:hypothetical protein
MTATFNPALTSTRDQLRLELGDTDTSAAVLADETYDALYTIYASEATTTRRYQLTLLALVRAILAKVAQQPVVVEVSGAIKVDFRARLPLWQSIAQRYGMLVGDVGTVAGYAAAGQLTYGGSLLTPFEEE